MLRETTWGLLDSKSVFYIKSVSERTYVPSLQYKVALALTTQSCFHQLNQRQSQFYFFLFFFAGQIKKKKRF